MVGGFQATMAVDDGGTGAAVGGASTAFAGIVKFNLPSLTAGKFDATLLAQSSDIYERELPTGTAKMGVIKGEMEFTKASYTRLQGLLAVRGHTWVITSPDDQSSGSPVTLVATLKGFLSDIGEVQFEKGTPAMIPFEITQQVKATSYA